MRENSHPKCHSIIFILSSMLVLLMLTISCEGGGGGNADTTSYVLVPKSTISIDGNFDDWRDIEPIAVDVEGDTDPDETYLDVVNVYLSFDEQYIYTKIDVAGDIPNRADLSFCYKVSFWFRHGESYQFDVWFNNHEQYIGLTWIDDGIYKAITEYSPISGFLRYIGKSLEFKVKIADIDFDLNGTLLDIQTFNQNIGDMNDDETIPSEPLNFNIDFFTLDLLPASINNLPVNEKAAVSVIGGSKPYSISVKNPNIAAAEYLNGNLIITGVNAGTTLVTVHNAESNSASLPVTVVNGIIVRPLPGAWSGTDISFNVSDNTIFVNNLELTTNNVYTGSNCDITFDQLTFSKIAILDNDKIDNNSWIPILLSGTFDDDSTLNLTISFDGYDPHCDAAISGVETFTATKD